MKFSGLVQILICGVPIFFYNDPYLFKYCSDQIVRLYVADQEIYSIIAYCHTEAYGDIFCQKKNGSQITQM